jgi:CRISPR-associated exonuclease Cas4
MGRPVVTVVSDTPAHPTDESPAADHDGTDRDLVAFSDLARACYCPRQCYYARRDDDRAVPASVRETQELAYRYPELRDPETDLTATPVAVAPATYRDRLAGLAERADWAGLASPPARDVYLAGKDCHGVAHKLLPGDDGDPPVPVIVSPGTPHETGVWEPQSVRAVAAAKALAWQRERSIPAALVEYPAHAVVRSVRLGVRRTAAYRRALRTTRDIDGPPPRLRDSPRCGPCDYREECGVETKSLWSRLRP